MLDVQYIHAGHVVQQRLVAGEAKLAYSSSVYYGWGQRVETCGHTHSVSHAVWRHALINEYGSSPTIIRKKGLLVNLLMGLKYAILIGMHLFFV